MIEWGTLKLYYIDIHYHVNLFFALFLETERQCIGEIIKKEDRSANAFSAKVCRLAAHSRAAGPTNTYALAGRLEK